MPLGVLARGAKDRRAYSSRRTCLSWVGTPPHIPSWGNIMAEGRSYVQLAFWIILFPGLFLALAVLAINMIGDGLRDLLKVR